MLAQLAVVAGTLVAVVLVSHLVEAARRPPAVPTRLPWAPDLPIRWVTVDGVRLRYVEAGTGRPLVLLHTLRSQLDMFQRVIPELSRRFRVYALDYPGHGYSDIPRTDYTPELFARAVAGFLERLAIRDAVLVGESIGGTIALLLAARGDPHVARVVAINPYDYARGTGLRRSSILANLLFLTNDVPILGPTVTRLRSYPVMRRVLQGGVHRPDSMPAELSRELYRVGNRRGHHQAFMSLVRHWSAWEGARAEYPGIQRPVLLLYGRFDWSLPSEREATARAIPGARMVEVENGGHFLALECPAEVVRVVTDFAEERD